MSEEEQQETPPQHTQENTGGSNSPTPTSGPNQHARGRGQRIKKSLWVYTIAAILIVIVSVFTLVVHNLPADHAIKTLATHITPAPTIPASPQAAVDFGLRQDQSHPIPGSFLGINGLGLGSVDNTASPYMQQANFKTTRIFTEMYSIFPTAAGLTDPTKQFWGSFDQQITTFSNDGLQPIISLDYTPVWMQPQNQNPPGVNNCLVSNDPKAHTLPTHVLPTYIVNGVDQGIATWAQLASFVVAHMDLKFPTVQPYYEIWNEPDVTHGLCATNSDPHPENTQLAWYTSLYAATAPLLKQQGQKDGRQILVGGPALGYPRGNEALWFPALVNNPVIAPYIDFVSYHRYFGNAADTWDTPGGPSMLYAMQKLPMGVIQGQEYISSVVRTGLQPNAQSTPIFIDEYNTFTGADGCCRYSLVYGPLWSSLFVTDILNTVLDKTSPYGPAANVPYLDYFAASNPINGYCLFGDTVKMDCSSNANMGPYPTFYSLQLLGNANYLDITNGGYVASAVSTNAPGIVATGFYTKTKDNILLVNTGANNYTQFTILAQNSASVQLTGYCYTLNKDNPQISAQQVNLTPIGNGYQVTVNVPAYSTVALSLSA